MNQLLRRFLSPQVKTPLTAAQTQPGLVGGYSVELVRSPFVLYSKWAFVDSKLTFPRFSSRFLAFPPRISWHTWSQHCTG